MVHSQFDNQSQEVQTCPLHFQTIVGVKQLKIWQATELRAVAWSL